MSLDGVPAAPKVRKPRAPRRTHARGPRKYGLLTVERWMVLAAQGTRLRIVFAGVDVTTRCAAADDMEGWVDLNLDVESDVPLPEGAPWRVPGEPHLGRWHGAVSFTRMAAGCL
jgi:hypothetical protein